MLEVERITVRFGGRQALSDVSLSAGQAEITGLIGPNGAGKTTLFNVITGLCAATRGVVRLDGADVTKLPPHRRARRGVSRTYQQLQLFGTLTVRENIELASHRERGGEPPSQRATQLMEMLGIAGLGDVVAQTVPTGQARLIELARALATGPRMLLLDEPASGQSPVETHGFKEILRDVAAQGVGVLLVEHDIPLVMDLCSRIYVLDFGSLIACDTPEGIRSNEAVISAYLGTQTSSR